MSALVVSLNRFRITWEKKSLDMSVRHFLDKVSYGRKAGVLVTRKEKRD